MCYGITKPLELRPLERVNLQRIARSPKSLPFKARRASAILSFSDGLSVFLITQVLRIEATTIHIFLDNAKYHRAKMVQEWHNSPIRRVKLHFLPPYCPHFNVIERLWRVMHKVISKNVIHANFKVFANAHLSFLRDKISQQWHNFKTTVTDNFSVKSNKDLNFIRC